MFGSDQSGHGVLTASLIEADLSAGLASAGRARRANAMGAPLALSQGRMRYALHDSDSSRQGTQPLQCQSGALSTSPVRAICYPRTRGPTFMTRPAQIDDDRSVLSQLRERMKELRCLYAVSRILADAKLTRIQRLRRIVRCLPSAWQYPSWTAARITLDGEHFDSGDFERVVSAQREDLIVNNVRRGAIEVGFTSTSPSDGQEPFLPEEGNLLKNVARQLSASITRREGAARQELLEQQLRHADRLATIGQFAAGAAHEINEPLSSVLGFAQLALKAPGTPQPVIEDLREIVAASLRAREIMKRLLLFAHQAPIERATVDLNEIVEEALFFLEVACERPGVRFVRKLASGLPAIAADPVQVRQVVVNLTVNATQAITAEGIVAVETWAEAQHVVLSVSDDGPGMSPEVRGRVFDPFFTTKELGEGTGLGLSVVHGIVASHGGTIEVESIEGEGSRFTVRLPAAGETRATP